MNIVTNSAGTKVTSLLNKRKNKKSNLVYNICVALELTIKLKIFYHHRIQIQQQF